MTDFEPSRGEFTSGHGIEVAFIRRFMGDRREDMIESVKVNGRPLVVIDPDDREAVERLAALLHNLDAHLSDDPHRESAWVALAYDALCDFANPTPPKPEEPTATGSIVHDHDGEAWVRHCCGEWSCLHSRPGEDVRAWAELVEQYGPIVLSEGVPDA